MSARGGSPAASIERQPRPPHSSHNYPDSIRPLYGKRLLGRRDMASVAMPADTDRPQTDTQHPDWADQDAPQLPDGRYYLDYTGEWAWNLIAMDGDLLAVKQIPYNGQLYRTTQTGYAKPGSRSRFGLAPEQVVDDYLERADSTATRDSLLAAWTAYRGSTSY